ncbi:Zinc knuckle CX2CX4HX4C [Corchorus olitorius]|uniref:Zinc knuckle CX2CX4HX4C n=1 Tax=Corchorus olitorius TaxID=93759 RepID=A0A1R3JVJ1_9ROSI|nr:Zinc knuckle CX2CX4HX4C [Corchorus olitorius]
MAGVRENLIGEIPFQGGGEDHLKEFVAGRGSTSDRRGRAQHPQYFLCLKKAYGGEMKFDEISYWIQVHNLSIDMISNRIALLIGNRLGRVLEIEEPKGRFGWYMSFLRMRIMVKASNPLIPGFCVPRGEDRKDWDEVKYEKLSDFCFSSGRLGHLSKHCKFDAPPGIIYGNSMRMGPARALMSPEKKRSKSWGAGLGPPTIQVGNAELYRGPKSKGQSSRENLGNGCSVMNFYSDSSRDAEQLPETPQGKSIKKSPIISPAKMLSTVMGLSNVFRRMHLKRIEKEELHKEGGTKGLKWLS